MNLFTLQLNWWTIIESSPHSIVPCSDKDTDLKRLFWQHAIKEING